MSCSIFILFYFFYLDSDPFNISCLLMLLISPATIFFTSLWSQTLKLIIKGYLCFMNESLAERKKERKILGVKNETA